MNNYDDSNNWCYECIGYGDDYYVDKNGELQSACDDCPFNGMEDDEMVNRKEDPKKCGSSFNIGDNNFKKSL